MSGTKTSTSQSRSGLRTLKRDFTENNFNNTAQGSRDEPVTIEWSPSPPAPKLTGQQARLKAIQDALASMNPPKPKLAAQPLEDSKTANKKRASDPADLFNDEVGAPPVKKKRELPSSWNESSGTSTSAKPPARAPSKPKVIELSNSIKPGAKPKKVPGVFLSKEQSQILELVKNGMSVFYTGSAGTGKSVLLREIIKALKVKYGKVSDAVAITASTGIAACNIGGVTIHSFAGIGLGIESSQELATKVRKNKKALTRWLRTKVLIIDEVSMVDGDLFDKLCDIGSLLRKNHKPFGGIQVIVTGDFFQLPPVMKGSGSVKFAFEAQNWSKSIERTFNLTKVFRQTDQEFVDMLNEMRFGQLSQESIKKFRSLSRPISYDDGLGPTELFPRREDVDRSNSTRLNSLQGNEEMPYRAVDSGIPDLQQREKLLSNFMAPQLLVLRKDAQVMLIKNMDDTLVNGSMGRVLGFSDPATYGKEDDDTYTIPSTKPSASSKASSSAKGSAAARVGQTLYPIVEFIIPNGGRRKVMVVPEQFKVELPSGEVQASRTQFPLILSWAMSIHKSQGQTLERVKVDLGKVFEKGQAYVALSRATSLGGLQVLNFDPQKVNAHPKVKEWCKTLETIQCEEVGDDEASWTL